MGTLPADIALLGFTNVEDFQRAWNLGPALKVDGDAGPITLAAAKLSASRHHAGQGDISAHFSASEAACHCGGHSPGCHRVLVLRGLLQALETLRLVHGARPLPIIDIYRCPAYNARQPGSASDSQHCYGSAADLPASLGLTRSAVLSLHVFSGAGLGESSGTVQHVDVRHLSGHNLTHSTPAHPATWEYAGR